MRKKKEEVFVGSGNVFEDLGYADPEEALAKAKLALQIKKMIKARRLTQKKGKYLSNDSYRTHGSKEEIKK